MDEQNNKRLGELIRLLAEGKPYALNEIAKLVEQILYAVGNVYYDNRADIEDAIQNLYVTLFDKAKRFRNNTNACAWVIRLFENSIKSHLRAMRREKEFMQEKGSDLFSDAEVDDRYFENHLLMRDLFDKLTCEERKLIIYYHWCKCSVRELAGILRKPKSTVAEKLKKLEEKIKNFSK